MTPLQIAAIVAVALVIFLRVVKPKLPASITTPNGIPDEKAFFDHLSDAAQLLEQVRLPVLAELVLALQRRDWYVALKSVRAIVAALRNSESLRNFFKPFFDHLLSLELADDSSREAISRQLSAATRAARSRPQKSR